MSEVILPPWIKPVTPETWTWIDDATQPFAPAFGRGQTQVGIWADPRWGVKRTYRGMRSDELAGMLSALNERRGQANRIRATVHKPLRGSFPATELLSNPTFASGPTGWSGTNSSIAVSDRVLRVTPTGAGTQPDVRASSTITVTQYVPYAMRAAFKSMRFDAPQLRAFLNDGVAEYDSAALTSPGLATVGAVSESTSFNAGAFYSPTTGHTPGNFFEVSYLSVARCPLIDNAPNLILQSDTIDNAAWTKTGGSITANQQVAPDGTTTGDRFVESGAAGSHFVLQNFTVSSAVADYCQFGYVYPLSRTGCWLTLHHAGGDLVAYFTLTGSGTVFSVGTTGTGWSNARAFISPVGGTAWYAVCLIGRKTGSQTSIDAEVGVANPSGTGSYTGTNTLTALDLVGLGVSQSSVPSRRSLTVATAFPTGTVQTGSTLYLKGLPASTSGLLLVGDFFEWNGELKQATSPLNSDAMGLGSIQFRPGLAGSPADNDPVIVNEPFGRFMSATQAQEFENQFGLYGEATLELAECYS